MVATDGAFAQWLSQAQIAEDRLTAEQRGLLQCAFSFRKRCGDDYYSSRLLSHFLLHCDSELEGAQIARLAPRDLIVLRSPPEVVGIPADLGTVNAKSSLISKASKSRAGFTLWPPLMKAPGIELPH